MAAKTTTKSSDNGQASETPQGVTLYEVNLQDLVVRIQSVSPLICHRFAEANIAQIEDKQQKKASRAKGARDPEREFRDSLYTFDDGSYGFPAIAFKQALVSACRQTDIPMTVARGAFQVIGDLIRLERFDGPHMRRDRVVIGRGITSVAYRPEFREWEAELRIRFNRDVLSEEQLINLVEIAGFAVGVGDWRPEKSGSMGMFEVKRAA
jgi:hypothetical protein